MFETDKNEAKIKAKVVERANRDATIVSVPGMDTAPQSMDAQAHTNTFIEDVLKQVETANLNTLETVVEDTPTIKLNQSIFEVVNKNTDILGKGSYGIVYGGIKRSTLNTVPVAIKINDDPYLIEREIKLYNYLWYYKRNGYVSNLRIPRLLWEGYNDDKSQRALVMEQLGHSLDKLFDTCHKCWNYATVCWIACEALTILKDLHSLGIIHRDIKPDNFAIGSDIETKSKLYVFDFGLSAQFKDTNGLHKPLREGLSLIGTMRYSSIHSHTGKLQSRRDDLESLGYVLLYFLHGTVSWKQYSSVKSTMNRTDMNKVICACKENLNCREIASPFGEFIQYSKCLGYADRPDYDSWIHLFRSRLSIDSTCFVPDWLITPQLPHEQTVNRTSKTRRKRHVTSPNLV